METPFAHLAACWSSPAANDAPRAGFTRHAEDSARWIAAGNPPTSAAASPVLRMLLNDRTKVDVLAACVITQRETSLSAVGSTSCPWSTGRTVVAAWFSVNDVDHAVRAVSRIARAATSGD